MDTSTDGATSSVTSGEKLAICDVTDVPPERKRHRKRKESNSERSASASASCEGGHSGSSLQSESESECVNDKEDKW